MYIFGYLRASTSEQDAQRAKKTLTAFVEEKGHRVASWYWENVSGASLQRPELMRLLSEAQSGDVILIEQVDRLSRLNDEDWKELKSLINNKNLKIVSLDLPTSHVAFTNINDEFTHSMLRAINNMMLDMLAAIARKDYADRRRRQAEGIEKAKREGKFKGRRPDLSVHDKVIQLRVHNGLSINSTANLVGVSSRTVIRIVNDYKVTHFLEPHSLDSK